MPDYRLHRNSYGRLVFTGAEAEQVEGVVPVHAFPISAQAECISLVSPDGHELAWIEQLADLPDDMRTLVQEELSHREFTPEILRIDSVSSYATPSTWKIRTDRGPTTMILRGEEYIRRLSQTTLLIADSQGVHFLVRDTQALDRHSRNLLDRFL